MDLYGLKTYQKQYHNQHPIEGLSFVYGDPHLTWYNKCPVIRQSYLLKEMTGNSPDDIWGSAGTFNIIAEAEIYLHLIGGQVKIVSSDILSMEYSEEHNPILKKPDWHGKKFDRYLDRPPSRYVLLFDYKFDHYPYVILYPIFKDGEIKKVSFPLEELRIKLLNLQPQKYIEDFL